MKYTDKHGTEIKAGMTIRYDSGAIDLIYDTMDAEGRPGLGGERFKR